MASDAVIEIDARGRTADSLARQLLETFERLDVSPNDVTVEDGSVKVNEDGTLDLSLVFKAAA